MKKGFTLAEVLITLGIIGVVAALTMPTLNTNVNAAKVPASLKKAMNTLQTAVDLVMAESAGDPLYTACGYSSFKDLGGHQLNMCIIRRIRGENVTDIAHGVVTYIRPENNTTNQVPMVNTTKDGISFGSFSTWSFGKEAVQAGDLGTDSLYIGGISVDINGYQKGPNVMSQDVFVFGVDSVTGEVYPLGSKAYSNLTTTHGLDKETLDAMNAETPDYTRNTYWGNGNCDATSVKNSIFCAGSVFDNDRVIYAYR